MTAAICSLIKSRPREVRRSYSDASLDVHGSVITQKVWMFDEDTRIQDDDSWTQHIEAGGDGGCNNHVWFIFTNLSTAQFCIKCSKTIKTKRAAYKCLECKRIGHLKCVSQYMDEDMYNPRQEKLANISPYVPSPKNVRSPFTEIGNITDQGETTPTRRQKPDVQPGGDNMYSTTRKGKAKIEEVIEPENLGDTDPQNQDATIQSQAKETLNSMKQSFVKRCKSLRKKVGKLKENWQVPQDNHCKKDVLCCSNAGDKDSINSIKITEQEYVHDERAAWLRSPIRLRSKGTESKTVRTSPETSFNVQETTIFKRQAKGNCTKRSRRNKPGSWNLDFAKLECRMEEVERKIQGLESAIPNAIAEWKSLLAKYSNETDICEATATSAPVMSVPAEEVPSSTSSASGSASVELGASGIVSSGQETSSSCHDNEGFIVHDTGLHTREDSLIHSTDVPQLHLDMNINTNGPSGCVDHQTSTPVTQREVSFLSASRKFQASQAGISGLPSILKDNSLEEYRRMEMACRTSSEVSQNRAAINAFLQRRSSQGQGNQTGGNSIGLVAQYSPSDRRDIVTQADVCFSPGSGSGSGSCPIASSTLRNGDNSLFQGDVSPVSFTFRNDNGDPGEISRSYARLLLDDSKQEDGQDYNVNDTSKNSVLSFTFRNDSSMCVTTHEEVMEQVIQSTMTACMQEDLQSAQLQAIPDRYDHSAGPASHQYSLLEVDGTEANVQGAANAETLSLTNVTDFTGDYPNSFDTTKTGLSVSENNVTKRKPGGIMKKRFRADVTEGQSETTVRTMILAEEPRSSVKFELYVGETIGEDEKVDEKGDCKTVEFENIFQDLEEKRFDGNSKVQEAMFVTASQDKVTTKPPIAVKALPLNGESTNSAFDVDKEVVNADQATSDIHTPVSSEKFRRHHTSGDAKYHFLHPKGMIKICSPRLELLSESPAKANVLNEGCDDGNLSSVNETSLETDGSSRSHDSAFAENHRNKGPLCSSLSNICTLNSRSSLSSSMQNETDSSEVKNDLQEQIRQQCSQIVDEGESKWETVLRWVSQGCDTTDLASLEKELEELKGEMEEAGNDMEQEAAAGFPDESVYYSFQGQSDELQNLLSPKQDQSLLDLGRYETCGLLNLVRERNIEGVKDLLTSDKTISESEIKDALEWSIQQEDRPIVRLILDDICRLIQASEEDEVVDVWPGYRVDSPWKPIFVLLTRTKYFGEWDTFMGYPLYKRRYDFVSFEAAKVIGSEIVLKNLLSIEDMSKVRNAVASASLHKVHSNITIINGCPCRSLNDGNEVRKEMCVVVHCRIKGIIPFAEQPFPRELSGIPVDVREAYFMLGMKTPPYESSLTDFTESEGAGSSTASSSRGQDSDRSHENFMSGCSASSSSAQLDLNEDVTMEHAVHTGPGGDAEMLVNREYLASNCSKRPDIPLSPGSKSTELNPSLLIGSGIGPAGLEGRGSIGGFIPLNDGSIGAITCAHLFSCSEPKVGDLVTQPADGDVPQTKRSARSVFGELVKWQFKPGSMDSTGVDAALIKITSRVPQSGKFVWVRPEQIKFAGFEPSSPPNFKEGKILKVQDLSQKERYTALLKVGSETGLTKGLLYLDGTSVRRNVTDLKLPNGNTATFFNNIEVCSINNATRFFDMGDSGSLVFMPLNESDLHCIGLAVGCTTYQTCIVTPIESVFHELGLPLKFINFLERSNTN